MRARKPRYQNGSVRKLKTATGSVWEVRYSEYRDGKRWQRTQRFSTVQYPKEKDVRAAIALTVAQVNAGTSGEKADAKFSAVIAVYRSKHLPTLQHSTRELNAYLLTDYVEPQFADTPLRDMKPLAIDGWLQGLDVAATTKAAIRSVMSICFKLAALHEFVPASFGNPMGLIRLKGVTKRQKKITELTPEGFKRLIRALPEPINLMVLLAGALGLRVSEVLALHWADFDRGMVTIQRKYTRDKIGEPKSDASHAPLPLDKRIGKLLAKWKPNTEGSEIVFPSARTGSYRSGGTILEKRIKPIAETLGLGRVTWHTLRHACRSWLASGKVEITTQKDLMRHADISTTANIYGHALTKDMQKAHTLLVGKLLP
jgi:integrase